MSSPDFFGISDRIRQLTAPPGFEGVHEDGFSWARQGTTWNDTTRIGPTEWNMLIGNLRGIGLMPDVVSNEFDPSGPYVLRDALLNFVVVRVDYLIAPYMASINGALALKAPLASPTFTGAPRAPTPASSDASTRLATTAYVREWTDEIYGPVLVSGLTSISELGAAVSQKADNDSPALSGTPTTPTPGAGDDSLKIANTGWVKDRVDEVVAAVASGTMVAARGEVAAAQTSALPAHTYANGTAGVGATITGNANGALATSVFDAISSLAGTPRVWVRLEGAKNGLYVVTQVGSAGTPFILTRATDSDTAAELGTCHFSVTGGATYAGRHYQCQQLPADITVGTTALTFALLSDGSAVLSEVVAARGAEASLAAAIAAGDAVNAAAILDQTVAHVPGYDTDEDGPFKTVSTDGYVLQTPMMQEQYDSDELSSSITVSEDGYVLQAAIEQEDYDSDEGVPSVNVSADGYVLSVPANQEEYDSDEPSAVFVVSVDGFVLIEERAEPRAPTPPAVVNADQIRRIKQKLRMSLRDSTVVCRVAFIGDSWFASAITVLFRDRLVAKYGDAGPGWVNLADVNQNKCADARVSVQSSGSWTDIIGYEPMPSTTAVQAAGAGAYRRIFGQGPIATAWLHYVALAAATGFYRWGAYVGAGSTTDRANYTFGTDHALDLSTGFRAAMLSGAPEPPVDPEEIVYWALEVGCSVGAKLGGVDLRNGNGGIIVDSLAKGGSNTGFWLIPPAAAWQTAYGSLNPDGCFVLHGTNDQAGTVPDRQVALNFDAINNRLRAGAPAADVIDVSPPENFLGRTRMMEDITAAVRAMAIETGVPHRDLQPTFGPLSRMHEYRSDGVRPLFNVDDVHPDYVSGGMDVVAEALETLVDI